MKLQDLISTLPVNVETFSKTKIEIPGACHVNAAGLYCVIEDTVLINEPLIAYCIIQGKAMYQEVIMHELIHWTGHEARLNRESLMGINTPANFHTEEATAQIGMFKLACQLEDTNIEKLADALTDYLLKFPEADLMVAEQEATRAVDYIINLYNSLVDFPVQMAA